MIRHRWFRQNSPGRTGQELVPTVPPVMIILPGTGICYVYVPASPIARLIGCPLGR